RPAPAPRAASEPLDPAVRIAPVESAGELIECVTYFLANEADIDELERAVDGLVRLAPFDNATRARLEPLAAFPPSGWLPSVSGALRLFMKFLLTGRPVHESWGYGHYQYRSPVHQQLCLRFDELMEFCHRHPRCAPLSTPTHARGFLDAAVLVERLAAYRARGVRPGPWDAMLAILRLAPVKNAAAVAAARALGDDTMAHALRFALGDNIVVAEPELRGAATRIRAQHSPDPARPAYGWRVIDNFDCPGLLYDIEIVPLPEPLVCDPFPPDESTRIPQPDNRPPKYVDFANFEPPLIHYFASLLPSDPEGFFAYRSLKKLNREHPSHAEKETRCYLLPLLHSAALGPMGRLLIAASLAGGERSHAKLAVDALLRAHALGQIDVPRMAEDLRTLIGSQLVSAGRLVKALNEAYGQEPHAAPLLLELLGAIVAAIPAARLPVAPRDVTATLVLMTEMVLAHSMTVPRHLCAALERAKLGTKAAALRKQLLARAAD
ncbi:MAG: hypothetical protein H7Y89_20945, partial [Steroidobacteraceae bacterium]|nr:hypothetical protein [Steroidobacteraceae bacterium]